MSTTPTQLIGNRLALVGAALYFAEWIGIALAPSLPTDSLGVDAASVAAAYARSPEKTAFLAGWLSVVILGRIAFCVGLRDAVRPLRRPLRLADLAVGAMTVSVTIEVLSYGLVATGAWLANAGAAPSSIVAFDAAGSTCFYLIIAPIGVAVLSGSLAMAGSRLFPRWLPWLGVVTGSLLIVGGVESATAAASSGALHDLGLMPIPLFWIWMIGTAVVIFRATPRTSNAD